MSAISYAIDRDARIVRFLYTAHPPLEETTATMLAALNDPAHAPGFGVLIDRHSVREAPSAEYIERIVRFFRMHQAAFGRCRCAVVVGGPAAYGMGRMAQVRNADVAIDLEVFTDRAEAERWLRGDPPPAS